MQELIFPAKVLLFGEYTILNGSKALAIAYPRLSGKWSFAPLDSGLARASHECLKNFITHPAASGLDLKSMKQDLERGLWFDSSIPHGFGLGSSGALIAGIYHRYGRPAQQLAEKKNILARLEDYFHGQSSGIDPLVSLINTPLLIHNFNQVQEVEQKLNLAGLFLLSTGGPRQTGPLVSVYQSKMQDAEFKRGCAEILSREVDLAIDCLLQDRPKDLFHHMWHISKFQWDYFSEMIPSHMREIWARGLDGAGYVLKLCGAGGGGLILGFSDKFIYRENPDFFLPYDLRELT
jgi:mevalonate kinase